MTIDSLGTLLTEELKDVYDAEKQITKALPKLAKAAHSPELRDALKEHLEVTKGQIGRLEEIFGMLNEKPKSRPCAGMKGIIQEGDDIAKVDKLQTHDNLKDVAIIAAAQRVEHYEIAAYGALRTYAEMLGNNRIADLLEQTKEEESEADRKLSSLSEELLTQETSEIDGETSFGTEGESNGNNVSRSRSSGKKTTSSARSRRK